VPTCSACGRANPEKAAFCNACGSALAAQAHAREERKVVTVVFCDLVGSTALGDTTDPEALRTRMRAYYEEMRAILERHGGTVEKFIGDAVMAVFGVPVAHEDDALRAVRAACEMQAAVPRLGLEARIGVNTGRVVAGGGDTLVTGDPVNVAARLEQAAEAGEVLIGAETRRLVRDAVTVEPVEIAAKGKPEAVRSYRLLALDPDAAPVTRHLETPLVGRALELEQLRRAFERTVREQRCHLFTLLGPAGVGKSRLVTEFVGGLDATVVQGRCLDYGEGITFWPVVSVLKQLGEPAAATLDGLVDGASTSNELFWLVRQQLEERAAERPLVVLFDDVHWGEPTFLDLIDHVADLSRGSPILLLCVARPDLLDLRPGWGGGKLNATTVLLEPLGRDECARLIDVHGGVEPDLRERILATADGNPLFVEEMVALVREGGDVGVPSTVHALLQARLDQLGSDERSVIERGAVEGEIFHRSAVAELSRTSDVETPLVGLVRKELIHPATSTLAGDHAFRFRHLLIRDTAYDALPKETRAELHERFADWLAAHGSELIELDEVLGYHLEQAALYRRELGRPDVELERRAGARLAAAGTRAAARADPPGAANLFGRARLLLPEDDPRRGRMLVERLLVLEQTPETGARLAALDELETSADEALRLHGRLGRLQFQLSSDTETLAIDEAERTVAEALRYFGERSDDVGLAHAYVVAAWTSWLQSRALPTADALARLREHAARADLGVLVGVATMMSLGPINHGPFPPDEIRRRLEPFQGGSPLERMVLTWTESHLAAIAGRFEEALAGAARAAAGADELGLLVWSVLNAAERAEILLEAGRLDEAVEGYREAERRLAELELTSFRSTLLINLGQALYARGEPDEAERLAIEGETIGAEADVVNFAFGRSLRAHIAADRGEAEAAQALAREAVEYAYRTDFPEVHVGAHDALAAALAAGGRLNEAAAELERALEICERYGLTHTAERTRERAAALGAGRPQSPR
jgi:class 3 adenylate cyclase/tetratricopeptide (TPR) repeat protein